MDATPERSKEAQNLMPLTQSKYVLAKYGIQVVDTEVGALQDTFIPEGVPIDEVHYHPGPRAIECKPESGKFSCDRDSCMRILWYYLFPCILIESCLLYMCDCCCDCVSTCIKRMEESYTFQCCDKMSCCKMVEN